MSQSDDKEFCVVQFEGTKEIQELPSKWLFQENNKQHCWWPRKNAKHYIVKDAPPKKTWVKYQVSIHHRTSTLEAAAKVADELIQMSEAEPISLRRKDTSIIILEEGSSSAKRSKMDEESQSILQPPKANEPKQIIPAPSNKGIESSEAQVKLILDKLESIEVAVKNKALMLANLRAKVKILLGMDGKKKVPEGINDVNVMKSHEEFLQFEAKLEDKDFMAAMRGEFLRIGGNNEKNHLHRILQACLSPKVASLYTKEGVMKDGQRVKGRFLSTNLMKTIKDAVSQKFAGADIKALEDSAGFWLKNRTADFKAQLSKENSAEVHSLDFQPAQTSTPLHPVGSFISAEADDDSLTEMSD